MSQFSLPIAYFTLTIWMAICGMGKGGISVQSHSLKLHHPATVSLHWVAEVTLLLYVQV